MGLQHLKRTRPTAPAVDPRLQLASPARQPKSQHTHQPPRPLRGQPVEAPHLAQIDVSFDDVLDWGVIALQRHPDFEHTPLDLTRTDRLLYHALRGHADML